MNISFTYRKPSCKLVSPALLEKSAYYDWMEARAVEYMIVNETDQLIFLYQFNQDLLKKPANSCHLLPR